LWWLGASHFTLLLDGFAGAGRYLVVANQNGEITITDPMTQNIVKNIECHEVQWTVTSTHISHDEQFLVYSTMSSVGLSIIDSLYELA
jgi:tricorn protease-like protein